MNRVPVGGTGTGSNQEGGADTDFRFGYVALVGRPNVGKSTLLNFILGQKLSIVTAKPQTTRQRISGIKTTERGQVVYLDTPGIHLAAGRALNRHMNRIAQAVLHDVDLILFVVEAGRWSREDEHVARELSAIGTPVVLVVNKVDLVREKSELLRYVGETVRADRFSEVLLISARNGDGVADVESAVLERLPFARPFYDEDQFTDRSERFLAAELVREQLMEGLHQELPYSTAVEIEEFRREEALLRIGAIVWVERESQKQIVIGKGGSALKRIGTRARHEMEALFGEKIFLRLWVKVSRDWPDSERALRQLGYDEAG